jgi:c-di-GMP phosphodiesterase
MDYSAIADHGCEPLTPAVLVARQPVFNRDLEVIAYELLYREEGRDCATVRDATQATAQVLASAVLDIGLARLVGNLPAFINFPASLLASRLQLPLAPERIVIEVLERAVPDPHLLDGLMRLRGEGYRIALDDFDIRKDSLELLEYADIVKVDIQQHTAEHLMECVRVLRRHSVQLVAEKVETGAELKFCMEAGFDLFQGYFLQRPETFFEQRAPSSRLSVLELLQSLQECRVSAEQIEQCITRDVGLSYRLLRCINSSYYSTPRQVSSIRQAILLLGYDELRRICSVILLTSLSNRPAYVTVQALTRARMCEGLCHVAGCHGSDGCFLTGLLSLVDVFVGAPMEDCLRELPLNQSIRSALRREPGLLGSALSCVLSYEKGEWSTCTFENLSLGQIGAVYAQAVEWAATATVALARD